MPVGNVNIIWYNVNDDGTRGNAVISENFPWNSKLETLVDQGIVEPGSKLWVEYNITDKAGNTGKNHRIVTFVDKTAPELEIKGKDKIRLNTEAAKNYVDEGVIATDMCDDNVSIQVQINWYDIEDPNSYEYDVESVGIRGEGRYNIVYTATDASGNKIKEPVQRLVYVVM